MRRMRAPVSVHSMRPSRDESVSERRSVDGSEEESKRSKLSTRGLFGPREKEAVKEEEEKEKEKDEEEDDILIEESDMEEEDTTSIATHVPRRVERTRKSAATTSRASSETEKLPEAMEDIDGNMVIYVQSSERECVGRR